MRALVVERDPDLRRALASRLQASGCLVEHAASGPAALDAVRREPFDLVLCELDPDGQHVVDLLPRLRAERPGADVVMLAAGASFDDTVQAMRRGARDLIDKPPSAERLRSLLANVRDRAASQRRAPDPELSPEHAAPRAVLDLVARAADAASPVLLRGEDGTGKVVLARALHARSARRDGPFVVLGCRSAAAERLEAELFGEVLDAPGAPVPGRLEEAEGGTLLLDGIDGLPRALAPKLLRYCLHGTFARRGDPRLRTADVRLVATASSEVAAERPVDGASEAVLRHLAAMDILVPPLRQRRETIIPLARAFAASIARRSGRTPPRLSPAAQRALTAWGWPGNDRELRLAMERTLRLDWEDVVAPDDILWGAA